MAAQLQAASNQANNNAKTGPARVVHLVIAIRKKLSTCANVPEEIRQLDNQLAAEGFSVLKLETAFRAMQQQGRLAPLNLQIPPVPPSMELALKAAVAAQTAAAAGANAAAAAPSIQQQQLQMQQQQQMQFQQQQQLQQGLMAAGGVGSVGGGGSAGSSPAATEIGVPTMPGGKKIGIKFATLAAQKAVAAAAGTANKQATSMPQVAKTAPSTPGATAMADSPPVKKVNPTAMRTDINKLLSEMGEMWPMYSLSGDGSLSPMEAGTNPDLQAGASISGVALGSTLTSEGVAGGLNSVPVDEEVMNLDDGEEDDIAIVLGSNFAAVKWDVVSPLKKAVEAVSPSSQVPVACKTIEDEIRELIAKHSLNIETYELPSNVVSVTDGEEPSSVVVVCKRQEMDPNVVFTIKLRQDYEKRSGQVASGGNARDGDDVLDICVTGSLDVEEESPDWSWTGYGDNLRMENVVQRLYV
ncbi:hypothetical protein BJ741DRAFT_610068 [Chytriomyces cf. hyalinus JEL632]|nr:hypothetical protein BJ741DRAFT_610068 [Chytriomyces cf. hyalinus JEL632]